MSRLRVSVFSQFFLCVLVCFGEHFWFQICSERSLFKCCHQIWPDAAGTRKLNLFCRGGGPQLFLFVSFCSGQPASVAGRLLGATNERSQTIFLINLCATGRNSQEQRDARFAACSTRVVSVADSIAVGSEEGRES